MRWHAKPCWTYRSRFNGIVGDLYVDCGHWPTGRSAKRDAMIEEISRLNTEQFKARDPLYCIYEVWQDGCIQPCGKTVWTHEDLCEIHKPFVDSLPWEYRYKSKAGHINDSRRYQNAFYGLSSRYDATLIYSIGQPKAIERILGKEKKR